jgi:hypothetical protein
MDARPPPRRRRIRKPPTAWSRPAGDPTSDEKQTDEKTYFYLCFYIFLAKHNRIRKNADLETKSGYTVARKRTNTDREPEN